MISTNAQTPVPMLHQGATKEAAQRLVAAMQVSDISRADIAASLQASVDGPSNARVITLAADLEARRLGGQFPSFGVARAVLPLPALPTCSCNPQFIGLPRMWMRSWALMCFPAWCTNSFTLESARKRRHWRRTRWRSNASACVLNGGVRNANITSSRPLDSPCSSINRSTGNKHEQTLETLHKAA